MSDIAVITIPADEWRDTRAKIDRLCEQVQNFTAQEQKELLTKKEVCTILKIGSSTFERYVNEGLLEITRFSTKERSRRYVKRAELESKIEAGLL